MCSNTFRPLQIGILVMFDKAADSPNQQAMIIIFYCEDLFLGNNWSR